MSVETWKGFQQQQQQKKKINKKKIKRRRRRRKEWKESSEISTCGVIQIKSWINANDLSRAYALN